MGALPLQMNRWYLDDGILAGPLPTLGAALEILQVDGPQLGLFVSRSKCHLWTPKASVDPLPDIFQQDVQVHDPLGGMRVLGSPIGSNLWTRQWLLDFLAGFRQSLDRLEQLASPRPASHILRSCLGSTKVMFLFRTLPWQDGNWLATKCSSHLRHSWELLLQTQMTEVAWQLACLPIEFGGLGILDPIVAQPIAFLAAFLSAAKSSHSSHISSLPPDFRTASSFVSRLCPSMSAPLLALLSSGSTSSSFTLAVFFVVQTIRVGYGIA